MDLFRCSLDSLTSKSLSLPPSNPRLDFKKQYQLSGDLSFHHVLGQLSPLLCVLIISAPLPQPVAALQSSSGLKPYARKSP